MNPVRFSGEHRITYPNMVNDPSRGTSESKLQRLEEQLRTMTAPALERLLQNNTPAGSTHKIPLKQLLQQSATKLQAPWHKTNPGDPVLWAPALGKLQTPFVDIVAALRGQGITNTRTEINRDTLTWVVRCANKQDKWVKTYFATLPGTIIEHALTPFPEASLWQKMTQTVKRWVSSRPDYSQTRPKGRVPVQKPVEGSEIKQVLTLWEPKK